MKARSLEVYNFIKNDFVSLWNGIANNYDNSPGKGNFVFALYPMILLEFAGELLRGDDKSLVFFAQELDKSNKQLFRVILQTGIRQKANLPYLAPTDRGKYLLNVLYGTIRNGHAHNYLQNVGAMPGNRTVSFAPNGPARGQTYAPRVSGTSAFDLSGGPGGIEITINSDVLFRQISEAMETLAVVSRKTEIELDAKQYAFVGEADLVRMLGPIHIGTQGVTGISGFRT